MSVITPANLPGLARSLSNSSSNAARLSSTAQQFESLLLGQWLKMESSLEAPEVKRRIRKEQMKDFAMQHVADELTKAGGIGIAAIVA